MIWLPGARVWEAITKAEDGSPVIMEELMDICAAVCGPLGEGSFGGAGS